MRTLKRFHMAIGFLLCFLGFFSFSALSPSVVLPAPSPNFTPSPLQAQQGKTAPPDSLARALERLTLQVDSELKANHERIESFQEITNQMFWLFAVIGTVATVFGAMVTYRGARQQSELHGRVLRIYESQAAVGEKYGEHAGQIFNLQESYSRGMADITTAFKDILENIKDVLEFRVKESQHALKALEERDREREEAAAILPEIKRELEELKKARDAQMDDLLNDTPRLQRSRHEYTEPDRELQASIFQFRLKMDGMPKLYLNKYADQPKYGPIFYYRGLIAFVESDIVTANRMLRLSEKLNPFTETGLPTMPHEQRIFSAFTQFYLGLIQKNYGTMRLAHDFVEKSFRMYGREEKGELLTLVTLAEILSYMPEELARARSYLQELFERVKLKVKAGTLTKAEAQYIPRAHLIYGNTFFVEKNWQEARQAYEEALKINPRLYYVHHSLGQILQEENSPQQAQAAYDKALHCLVESQNLETKPERGTQIMLNALAFLCLRGLDPAKAKPYRDAVSDHIAKVRELNGFELKFFSFRKKRMVGKEEFLRELFD